jgi:hypothetical protein
VRLAELPHSDYLVGRDLIDAIEAARSQGR